MAPKLVEVTDEVLFGDIWERPGLSPRDRSLVTVSVLAALYRSEQLGYHLGVALDNGLGVEELSEAITHLAFYAGWPNAMTAITRLKKIADERSA
nr:carboxymuconolactone decarboxylase family protein [Streptomyces sp. CLI2509]